MVYGDFKYLAKRTVADKILRDLKHLKLGVIKNMMDIKED